MRKRIASALLTLVMLLTLVPAMGTTAQAAGDTRPAPIGYKATLRRQALQRRP